MLVLWIIALSTLLAEDPHRCSPHEDGTKGPGEITGCCSASDPCPEFIGDCNHDDECEGDLICGIQNEGTKFGYVDAGVDVCGKDPALCVKRPISHLECTSCKCGGGVLQTKAMEPMVFRKQCETAALESGAKWYNWLGMGLTGACVFGEDVYGVDLSSDENCSEENGNRVEADKPWMIYSVASKCSECSKVDVTQVCDHCKCALLEHIQSRDMIRKEPTLEACARETYEAGFRRFSYKSDSQYCYFGTDISSESACGPNQLATHSASWGIYEVKCY